LAVAAIAHGKSPQMRAFFFMGSALGHQAASRLSRNCSRV
jgi:hypothetical protein